MINNKKVVLNKEIEIKKYLAGYLGIEENDLENDDHLKEDLHMNSLEIADFFHLLKDKGIDLNLSKIDEIESLQDIIDISFENEEF